MPNFISLNTVNAELYSAALKTPTLFVSEPKSLFDFGSM